MKKNKVVLITLAIILYCHFLFAITINIPTDYSTIQFGIDASVNGDTILVADGTYLGYGNKELDFLGKAITVKSVNGSANTTIWCQYQGRGIWFHTGEDSTSVLEGFTIIEGRDNYGAGIMCENSNPTIRDIIIKDCRAGFNIYAGGGGIYLNSSNPNLVDMEIYDNISYHSGGGIFCTESNPNLQNVLIANNTAYNDGSGIYCKQSNPTLTNVTIADNTANLGGGIYCFLNSNPALENTILWNNSPQEICFSNSNTANSITVSYSDIMDGETGIITNDNGVVNWLEGNINQNPLFDDPENENYNLTWVNFPENDITKSPCINTGNPDYPLDPDNTIVEIGAFYYHCNFQTNLNFIADTRFGYETLSVNFTSSTDLLVENYYWDFESDGIIDSNEENPIYNYTQSGVFDVKLKVSVGAWVDSLVKTNYIVIQENELLPPEDLTINNLNNNAILNWTAIDVPNDCMGEYFTVDYDKGSIGYLGASRNASANIGLQFIKYINSAFWENESYISSEFITEAKIISPWTYPRFNYNYFGDPAFNLMAKYFTAKIPENILIVEDSGTIVLNWDISEGATSYSIYSSDNPNTGFQFEATVTDTTWSTSATVNKKFFCITSQRDVD